MNNSNLQQQEKLTVAIAAVKLIKDNDIVGLGTGTTATLAIIEIGNLVKNGLKIIGVPSSIKTNELGISLGIPLLKLGEVDSIDISIDGADEFTIGLDLIKGGGGALFREKIVASLSKNRIIVTDTTKKVERLGAFKVPIEVNPNAYQYVFNQIKTLGGTGFLRINDGKTFITDNQNYIIDADFGLIDEPAKLSIALNQIEGVLAHGIFVNLTSTVLMAKDGEVLSFGLNISPPKTP